MAKLQVNFDVAGTAKLNKFAEVLAPEPGVGEGVALFIRCSKNFLTASRENGGVHCMVGLAHDLNSDIGIGTVVMRSGDEMHAILLDPTSADLAGLLHSMDEQKELLVVCISRDLRDARVVRLSLDEGLRKILAFGQGSHMPDPDALRRAFIVVGLTILGQMNAEAMRSEGRVQSLNVHEVHSQHVAGTHDDVHSAKLSLH